jgi:hypothetical protein
MNTYLPFSAAPWVADAQKTITIVVSDFQNAIRMSHQDAHATGA